MKLWNRLYNAIWLAFFSCVLIPRWMSERVGPPVHVLLGLALLVLVVSNARSLSALPVPARLKRISKVTAGIAVVQGLCGIALAAQTHVAADQQVVGWLLRGTHVVFALAILAQTSSVATAYDMWEEKEFEGAVGQSRGPAQPPA